MLLFFQIRGRKTGRKDSVKMLDMRSAPKNDLIKQLKILEDTPPSHL